LSVTQLSPAASTQPFARIAFLERQQTSARLVAIAPPRGGTGGEWGLAHLNVFGFPSPRSVSATEKAGEGYNPGALEQSLCS
jgi:hypothetical protein